MAALVLTLCGVSYAPSALGPGRPLLTRRSQIVAVAAPPPPPLFYPRTADHVPYLRPGQKGSLREQVRELLDAVSEYNNATDVCKVYSAFLLAMRLHHGQMRSSGDPYITHPLEVATILASMRMDVASVVTGLLHDTVEDTGATSEYIEARAGTEVARIVDGVTKLSRMEMAARVQQRQQLLPEVGGGVRNGGRSVGRGGGRSGGGRGGRGARRAESQAADDSTQEMDEAMQARAQSDSENLRKLVLALSTDVRVLLVKLIDRLHNMRTLHFISNPASRRRKAHETLNIYAPLADRLGMARLCHELETLSFRELRPTEHAEIVAEQQRCYHSHELQGMVEGLSELLDLQDHTGGESTRRRSRGSRSSSSVVIRDCAVGSSDGTECWVGDSYLSLIHI